MRLTSLGLILLIAGFLLLGLGVYFFLYTEFSWLWGTTFPYQLQGMTGIVFGVILLALGISDMFKTQPAVLTPSMQPPQPAQPTATLKRFCENCGSELSMTAKYCAKCGQRATR